MHQLNVGLYAMEKLKMKTIVKTVITIDMEQYINKAALAAEIEKAIDSPAPSHDQQCDWEDGYWCGLSTAECIIDTFEVKEVDLENKKEVIVKGFVAVDNGGDKMTWNPTGRRVAFFPKKPVRDLLTDRHYWAAHISPYDVIHLGYEDFPKLKWEDEPIEVEVVIKAQKGK